MRVVIIGAGIVGASVAWNLARRGVEATVIDAGPVAGGASGRGFGWLNASFHLDDDHYHLRVAAMRAWERAEAALKSRALSWPGTLWWEEEGAAFDAFRDGLRRLDYPVAELSRTEIEALEPALAAKSMPCGTQVVATEPLGARAAELIPSDCCVEDNNFLLDYFRLSADGRLLYGGGVIYGARDPARVEALMRPKLLKTFPQLADVRIDFGWTGNFLLTLSRLPQVGRLADNVYYAQGCSGHGVTYTHLIGRVLGEAIRGQAERFDAFARLPHLPFPGGRLLRVPLTALGAAWYDLRDRLGV